MKTLKFKLKRKLSGKAIRKAERVKSQFKVVKIDSYIHGESPFIVNVPIHRGSKFTYAQNRVAGKKYPLTIYQLEDQHRNKHNRNTVNYADWFVFRFLSQAKNETQKKRVYKLYPTHDPKEKRKRDHEKAVQEWKKKLLLNHQNQVNGNF